MTVFAYKCRNCGYRWDHTSRSLVSCPACLSHSIGRDYSSVQIGTSAFKPHFNHAVGAYVNSSRQFDDLLKVRGEQAGSTYTRLDPGDAPTPTRDTEILETQMRTITDRKINPAGLV